MFQCDQRAQDKGRPFKFFNHMASHVEFLQVVSEQWCVPGRGRNRMKMVWSKLKNVKVKLKMMHKTEFANMNAILDNAREELQRIQTQMRRSPSCSELFQAEKECILLLRK